MRAYTTITFNMFDTAAKRSATVSCADSQSLAGGLLTEKIDHSNYASTEVNGLYLDGSYGFLESGTPSGLYSRSLCGNDGNFVSPVDEPKSFLQTFQISRKLA